MDNARFETLGLSSDISTIQPAYAYWLKRGEVIAPKWDSFEWHWEHASAMMTCDFRNNTSAGNCQICNYCSPPSSTNGPPCMGFSTASVVGFLRIASDRGFMKAGIPDIILDYVDSDKLLRTCNNSQDPLFFEPSMSGLYRFWGINFKYNFVGGTNGEVKIHIVEPSGENSMQTTAYQLNYEELDGRNYWTWTIKGDPFWMENFSPNLRVSNISILRGACVPDPAQGKECISPMERIPVKPSRIIFLPDFYTYGSVNGYPYPGEAQHRCYIDPNAMGASEGKFINLTSCLETSTTNSNPSPVQKYATPTYEFFPVRPTEKLTWLVEFNIGEGADADLMEAGIQEMPPGAQLIIEFTIQPK
jgi:hypothetical protein